MNQIAAVGALPTSGAEPALPHNVEAEQQLLGAILTNNDVYDRVSALVGPQHFFEPVHARIFEVAAARIQKNALASPVTLRAFLEDDPGLRELGGPAYLVRLAGAAIGAFAARDYAQMIHDLAIRRELIALGRDISAKAAQVDVESEPKEQIVEAEQALYRLGEQGQAGTGFQSFLRAVTDAVQVANAAYQREGGLAGLASGLVDLDGKLGGLHRSDLLILAGRPSMGKTSLATNIAFNIAKAYRKGALEGGGEGAVDGGVVGFFFPGDERRAARGADPLGSVGGALRPDPPRRHDRSRVSAASWRPPRRWRPARLFIDDTPALPIAQLAARARRLKRTHGLDVLFVDYLQLVRGNGRSENRVNEISEITQGLKAIAKELDIPVVALSQLSRQVEKPRGQAPAALGSARVGFHRAGRGRGDVSCSARSTTPSARSPRRTSWRRWPNGRRGWSASMAAPRW